MAPMTLARAFAAELESGATEFHALVGNFIFCAILGKKPMLGDPIKSEQVRMTAAIFYAKTQMGWKETVVNEQANKDGKPNEPPRRIRPGSRSRNATRGETGWRSERGTASRGSHADVRSLSRIAEARGTEAQGGRVRGTVVRTHLRKSGEPSAGGGGPSRATRPRDQGHGRSSEGLTRNQALS